MRVVLAGGHGLLGSALTDHLAAGGHDVVRLTRGGEGPATWDPAAGRLDPAVRAGADAVVRSMRLTLAGRYQKDEGYRLLASVKRTILGADLFAEGVYSEPGFIFLAGFYKDWKALRLYGEYQYDDEAANDHSFGLAALYNRAFGSPVDLGLKWLHTLHDDSGSLTLGAVFSPRPRLTLGAAVPLHYGATGSRYVIDNEDPAGRRIALALTAKISGTF